MENDLQSNEYQRSEAVAAADEALDHLYAAQNELRKARNWGFYDMLGGGMFGSMIKHSKMQKANNEIQAAKEAVARLMRAVEGIEGVDTSAGFNVDMGGVWGFMDVFMDNIFADMMVQQRINEAQAQVEAAIQQVEYLRDQIA